MDLDLNLEPLQAQAHPAESPGRLLAELGDHHGRIEERIRLLESVVARFRPPLHSSSTPPTPISTSTTYASESDVVGSSIKPCKIDGTHLLAEALAMDSTSEQTLPSASASASTNKGKRGGSVFDCNICFSLSKDPILTCCGHLFCWPCFYSLPNSDSYASRACPVCDGEVLETDITPIYGASSSNDNIAPPSSSNHPNPLKIPPRPRARRIDSVRQRLGYPPLPPHQRATQFFVHRPGTSQLVFQPHHLSRFLSQTGNPLGDSLAEHVHVESHVNRQQLPRTQTQPLPFNPDNAMDNGDSLFPSVVIPLHETNSMASIYPLPPQSQTGTSIANTHSGNPLGVGIREGYETTMSRSSSSSRRASARRRRRDELGR